MNLNKDIVIRPAEMDDADFIATNQVKMAWETEQFSLEFNTVHQGVLSVIENPAKGFYIVAVNENEKCGCLLITPEWSDWRNAWIWWIQSVYVLPGHRKAGVFGKMYHHIKQLVMQQPDVSGIRLYVDNTNVSAREVYTRIGMNGEHYRTFEWIK